MRILAIYRHYWPDATPYGKILRIVLEHLAEQGHEVVVYTAQPAYNDVRLPRQPWRERLANVDVIRVRLLPERKRWTATRILNFLIFLLRAILHTLFRPRYDLVIANTFPPILNGLALRAIRRLRGIPYIYHCQDIHPESARLAKTLKPGWFYELLLRADRRACEQSERVVTLSNDMRDSLARRGISEEHVRVINNPPLDNYAGQPVDLPAVFLNPNAFRVLFAGNIGGIQGLDLVVRAASLVAHTPHIQFIFMGEGGAKQDLIKLAGELVGKTVFFVPFQPIEIAWAAMSVSQLGIVSLSPGLYQYAFPSKSMTYLSAGCPILTMIEDESELAHLVRQYDLGFVHSQRDPTALADTIHNCWLRRSAWSPEARLRLRQSGEELFGRRRMLLAWDHLLAELAPKLPLVSVEC